MAGIKISDLPPNTLPLVGDEQLELENADGDSTRATVDDIAAAAAGLDASFITVSANAQLANERVLTAGTNISLVDTGPNGTLTINAAGVSFPLLAPDGSAGAPSYSFAADSDIGMFRIGTDSLGFAAGGLIGLRVVETGGAVQIQSVPGSAAVPAYSFVAEPDTGMYNPGADRIGFALGGIAFWQMNNDSLLGQLNNSVAIRNIVSTATIPNLHPDNLDLDTGIGQNAVNEVSIIGGGVELARAVAAASGGLLANNLATGAGLERVLTTADLSGPGGDVFKVGTPVDNQVGVWTGDGTIEGDPTFTYDKSTQTFGFGAGTTFLGGSGTYRVLQGNWSLDGESAFAPVLSIIQGGINNQSLAITPTAMVFGHDASGLVFNISGNLARWEFETALRVTNSSGLDWIEQDHDGVDYNFAAVNTGDINFTGLSGRIMQDAETLAFVSEITGDVAKVGTPVDNQIGVWTGDGTIEGTTGLTYDGSDLDITGNITLTGNVDGINIAVDVPANTAKVTNATHTGQVTGSVALALDVTAITAQPASGVIVAGDTIITNDGGVLSEATFTQLLTFFDANLSFLAFSEFQFFADQLENPNNADWVVNALAPASADSNNAGLTVRLFDDTTEEGVGFTIEVPSGATNIVFDFVARAETAPGIANTVGLNIYNRGIPDNAAVQAFSAATQLTDIDIPTNEFFQEDTQTVTLATLGVTAGETTQFELTRVAPTGGTDLTGDWAMLLVKVSFT